MIQLSAVPAEARANPGYPPDDNLVDASGLSSRLLALNASLDNLPRQAKRLIRLRMRREKPDCSCPVQAGCPPGYRKQHVPPSTITSPTARP